MIIVLAMLVLGEPLGALLFPESVVTFYTSVGPSLLPEPTEQARYLISLAGPVLLAITTQRVWRRDPRLEAGTTKALVVCAQIAVAAFVIVCIAAQRGHAYGPEISGMLVPLHVVYFTAPTLLAAVVVAAAATWGLRNPAFTARLDRWTRETITWRIAAFALAVLLTAIWLLPAVNFDDTIATAQGSVVYHVQFTFDEAMAVLDGRSPLGDFAAQYGSLWPYPLAAGMSVFGASLGTFTLLVALISGIAMLATFDLLRRLTHRSVLALLLFLPLLATGFFMIRGPLEARYAISNLFGSFPMRYAGPLLLAWLTVCHLDDGRPRRAWPVFLAAGLVVLNNGDFGIPALGATVAAILWAHGRPTWRWLGQLAAQAAIGLAGAYALVAILLLARTGSLPDLSLLFVYARLFAVAGFAMLPFPALGMHVVIYLTFVAAIGVATVRALRAGSLTEGETHEGAGAGSSERALTGALVWSGIFGLGAGSYFIGRSHPEVLTNMFAAWALSLALLSIVVVRALLVRPWGWPTIPEVAVLIGLGVTICSLAQTPQPWTELDRLQAKAPSIYDPVNGERFVSQHTRTGEPVLVLTLLGHRLAVNTGVDNLSPYSGEDSMPTVEQLDDAIAKLRAEDGDKVFLSMNPHFPEMPGHLMRKGFLLEAQDAAGTMMMWVDGRR